MHSISRKSILKMIKNILIIILIFTAISMFIYSQSKCIELKEFNSILSSTINEQTNVIENLQAENIELSNYITLLEDEKARLKIEIQEMSKEIRDLTNTGGSFKSYTDYRCLSKKSSQWKLQEQAYTDKNGLRKIGDAYLVALGSYYGTTLGTKYTVTLSSGNTFKIILCDYKSDKDTNYNHQVTVSDGSILEFYVDTKILPKRVRTSGTIGTLDFFAGDVVSIVKV